MPAPELPPMPIPELPETFASASAKERRAAYLGIAAGFAACAKFLRENMRINLPGLAGLIALAFDGFADTFDRCAKAALAKATELLPEVKADKP